MKKYLLLIILFNLEFLLAHCQVPCGIYDDAMRIMLIKEDFDTIKKAINEIEDLSKKNDPQSLNQLNRWIDAKDDHASNIQKIVSDYFLTQRIKKTNGKYEDQLFEYAKDKKEMLNESKFMDRYDMYLFKI